MLKTTLNILVCIFSALGIVINAILIYASISSDIILTGIRLNLIYLIIPVILFFSTIYYWKLNKKRMFYITLMGLIVHIGNYYFLLLLVKDL